MSFIDKFKTLPRDSRDTMFLLFVIGWVVLPQVNRLPVWCSVLTAGVLIWRGALSWRSRPLPGIWWRASLLAIALGATFFTYRTILGREAGVTLVVVLLALKTLELRGRRDAFVVFFLGFFTMLSNFFFSQSLLTALAMVLGLLGLLTALVNAHMPVGKPPLRESAGIAAKMALFGTPVMVVLFMLFPRVAPLWGAPADVPTGRSGLSSTMEVGNITSLALDDGIALRVKFEGPPPRQSELYFRGPVLSDFDGRQWRPQQSRLSRQFPLPADLEVSGQEYKYEVTLEQNNKPWLFLLEAVKTPPSVSGMEVAMLPDLQWMLDRPVNDLIRYRATSYTQFTHGPKRSLNGLGEFMLLPEGSNPRTRELAQTIKQENPGADTAGLVTAILTRLRTGGYSYTLEPGVYGRETSDEFWFDKKAGFCEHIASSFVILMRAMNIPARIVTGYQGGELNAVDNFWVVRQADAHAWAEVWESGKGWVRVDPTGAISPERIGAFQRLTPPRGVFAGAMESFSPTLLVNMRATWEAVNNGWNQWVLNYTQSKQVDLLKNLGFTSPSWEDLATLLLGIVIGVSALGAVWAAWEKRKHDPWLRLLTKVRKQMLKHGVAVDESTPPRQMAIRARAKFGESAMANVYDWLLRLEALRYARPSANSGGRAQMQQSLAQLQREWRSIQWPGENSR